MLFKAEERVYGSTEKPRGGHGFVHGLHAFEGGRGPQGCRIKMVAEMILDPDSAIGFHIHTGDEEMYLITKGRGMFIDTDQSEHPVAPGDVMMIRPGEGHGLSNCGPGPLHFTAVIAGPLENK